MYFTMCMRAMECFMDLCSVYVLIYSSVKTNDKIAALSAYVTLVTVRMFTLLPRSFSYIKIRRSGMCIAVVLNVVISEHGQQKHMSQYP